MNQMIGLDISHLVRQPPFFTVPIPYLLRGRKSHVIRNPLLRILVSQVYIGSHITIVFVRALVIRYINLKNIVLIKVIGSNNGRAISPVLVRDKISHRLAPWPFVCRRFKYLRDVSWQLADSLPNQCNYFVREIALGPVSI